MADILRPRKVFSPKSIEGDASAKLFDDEPLMINTASDASTASTNYGDEPLMVALPCYDFLGDASPKEYQVGSVFTNTLASSEDENSYGQTYSKEFAGTSDFPKQLEEENRRLEEENAMLRAQYSSFLQMASQGFLTPYGVPNGYSAWPQAQWPKDGLPTRPALATPEQKQTRKTVQFPKFEVDVDADADCSRSGATSDADSCQVVPRTSVMLRNLPNSYTRNLLMKLLDDEGFAGKYDFIYLPIDFKTRLSLAYAFINLVDAEESKRFWAHFNGFSNWAVPSHKIASVNWSEFQGLPRHIERYRSSPVMHEGVPDEYKPVLLSGGQRIAFPQPMERVRAPRHRIRSKAMKPGRVS
jgi:hypothetical protein